MKQLKWPISLFSLCAVESFQLRRAEFDENSENLNAFFSMFSNGMTYFEGHHVKADVLSDQNCGRGIFFWHRLFLVTNRKFQSRLTLSAYNSASKALNLKKYHIFGIPRTSAFTWYPPRYMMQHQNFEKLTKYKKRQNFVNFHCRPAQFMSEAAARTILTLRTLDIAHFEAETRSFSGVSSKLGPP